MERLFFRAPCYEVRTHCSSSQARLLLVIIIEDLESLGFLVQSLGFRVRIEFISVAGRGFDQCYRV